MAFILSSFVTCHGANADDLLLLGAYLRDHSLRYREDSIHHSEEKTVDEHGPKSKRNDSNPFYRVNCISFLSILVLLKCVYPRGIK